MLEPVGKKLQQTRRQKNLSVEEVARATKIHRDRIVDLEEDEYGNFPNLSYARSFLLLYAKHLGVDVHDVAGSFERQSQIGHDDYEYLTNTPQERPAIVIEKPKRAFLPWALAISAIALAMLVSYLVISAHRLGDLGKLAEKDESAAAGGTVAETPAPPPARPSATPKVENVSGAKPAIGPATPHPTSTVPPVVTSVSTPRPSPSPQPDESVEVRRAVPLSNAEEKTALSGNEVVLRPLKKTWVKVQQGDASSPVVFEAYLYPDGRPLTLRGDKFYIEADADGANLRITRNGKEIAYTPPGLEIE